MRSFLIPGLLHLEVELTPPFPVSRMLKSANLAKPGLHPAVTNRRKIIVSSVWRSIWGFILLLLGIGTFLLVIGLLGALLFAVI